MTAFRTRMKTQPPIRTLISSFYCGFTADSCTLVATGNREATSYVKLLHEAQAAIFRGDNSRVYLPVKLKVASIARNRQVQPSGARQALLAHQGAHALVNLRHQQARVHQ